MSYFTPLLVGVVFLGLYLALRSAIAIYCRSIFVRMRGLMDDLGKEAVTEQDKKVLAALGWIGRWQTAAFLVLLAVILVVSLPIVLLFKNLIKESPPSTEAQSFQEGFGLDPTGSKVWEDPKRPKAMMLGLLCTVLMYPSVIVILLIVLSPVLLFGIASLSIFRLLGKSPSLSLGSGPDVWRLFSRMSFRFLLARPSG